MASALFPWERMFRAGQRTEKVPTRFVSETIPDIGSPGFDYCDSKSKGWFLVKKFIAILFVAAVVAATVVGCGTTTTKSTTGTQTTTKP
jgi:hypothetical protein